MSWRLYSHDNENRATTGLRVPAASSKAAMPFGGILLVGTTLGVVTFDPIVMIAG
jgi:hypothetical protein